MGNKAFYSLATGDAAAGEAVRISMAVAVDDLESIRSLISSVTASDLDASFSESQRCTLIRHSWSIVDRVDLVRQLFIGTKLHKDDARDNLLSVARRLRNKMDHLPSNTKNINKAKKSSAIYGVLAAQIASADDWQKETDGRFKLARVNFRLIGLSSTPPNFELKLEFPNSTYRSPIGEIFLCAFDEYISLDKAIDILRSLNKITEEWDTSINDQMRDHIVTSGFDFGGRKADINPINLRVLRDIHDEIIISRDKYFADIVRK